MDYSLMIGSVIVFVENRLGERLDYRELEAEIGFSAVHIRQVFARHTGMPLVRYVRCRQIAHAAFDLIHTKEKTLDIGAKYGFPNPDSFTRAFRRVTGMTPQEFRSRPCAVGRIKLCAGVYGVGIIEEQESGIREPAANC
ncbi:helix-turn-helix transcriptional regulator [Paenibacillus sp. YN15]|uniref:helix-turn-helix transcriptional regulator n=1 Tax=Paenibacillus sp. YN15 TaxID=1742774 RepID=UPI000DCCA978|nr:AraC family transcriptional regulator [Paenibacillus sp. YN15]RAU91939.1 AraC family transcriptional regulator [Paenibacillus sp. YN15]